MLFSPYQLFSGGEQGVWFDLNDLTTLFQDSAGTTPVTAAGQPVGLMLDKRLGLVLGPELRSAGVTGLAGTATAASYDGTSGAGSVSRGADVNNQSYVQWSGLAPLRFYEVAITVTSGIAIIRRGSHTNADALSSVSGAVVARLYAGADGLITITSTTTAGSTATFTGLSIRELPGNHAFIATAASRPMLRLNATTGAHYFETDGSDDWMQTNPIDFTATDKVSVFTGVRKLSDAATGIILELSIDRSANPGAFDVRAPDGVNEFTFLGKGSAATAPAQQVIFNGAQFAAPISAVLSFSGNISADLNTGRLNGIAAASATGDQGAGNYGNYPLYLFRRGGTTLPFNGHFYGLTIVGRLCTAVEARNVELLYANKAGVILA